MAKISVILLLVLSACTSSRDQLAKDLEAQTLENMRRASIEKAEREARDRACITPDGPDLSCYDKGKDKQFSVVWCQGQVGMYAPPAKRESFRVKCFDIWPEPDRTFHKNLDAKIRQSWNEPDLTVIVVK